MFVHSPRGSAPTVPMRPWSWPGGLQGTIERTGAWLNLNGPKRAESIAAIELIQTWINSKDSSNANSNPTLHGAAGEQLRSGEAAVKLQRHWLSIAILLGLFN